MNDKGKMIRSFVLGFFLGGALVYTGIHFYQHYCADHHDLWGRHRKLDSKRILEKLNKELDLNAEQKTQVEKILESKLPKIKELRETVRPQFSAIRESIQTEIRGILQPEQQAKFDRLVENFEKRRKEWEDKMDAGK